MKFCCQIVATTSQNRYFFDSTAGKNTSAKSFPLATAKSALNDFVLAWWHKLICIILDYPIYIGSPNFCYHFAITDCYHTSRISVPAIQIYTLQLIFQEIGLIFSTKVSFIFLLRSRIFLYCVTSIEPTISSWSLSGKFAETSSLYLSTI